MTKRVLLIAALGMFCVGSNLGAKDVYQSFRHRIANLGFEIGDAIESIDNVPLIDKLTNLLPFAMVAACFKQCPGQTMVVLTGLLCYVLSQNESVRVAFKKCKAMGLARFGYIDIVEIDDAFFVIDNGQEQDFEEELEMEEELLEIVSFDDEYYDNFKNNTSVEQPVLKFL